MLVPAKDARSGLRSSFCSPFKNQNADHHQRLVFQLAGVSHSTRQFRANARGTCERSGDRQPTGQWPTHQSRLLPVPERPPPPNQSLVRRSPDFRSPLLCVLPLRPSASCSPSPPSSVLALANLTHSAHPIVFKRLVNLFPRVHDEWSVPRDWFIQ